MSKGREGGDEGRKVTGQVMQGLVDTGELVLLPQECESQGGRWAEQGREDSVLLGALWWLLGRQVVGSEGPT